MQKQVNIFIKNINYQNLFKMSSLLQRRNKKLDDLKCSISVISIVRRVQQNYQSPIDKQTTGQFKTHQGLLSQQATPNTSKTCPKRIDSILQSQGLQIFRTRGHQYDYSQNAFEEMFRLEQKLGEGAHGVVKKCIHKQTGKVFAVKLLQMEDQHYRSIKTNFINIKQIKHDSIIRYKAIYLNSQTRLCNLIMEYSPYSSLKGGMDQNSLRLVFHKVFDALTYLHQKNICHRDIKPDNILCNIEKRIVKLIDFGVSKNMKLRGRYEEMLTNTGTCYYKAPQMFLGGSYTEKVDSWAVGITLYEMIAGTTPFQSEYHSDTINNIISKQVSFQNANFIKFSSLVKDLITRLLKKDPKERLTCEQAKKHLWFVPHLNDIDLMQSAGFGIKPSYKSQQNITWLLQRRSSVNQVDKIKSSKMNKSQKQTMKRWLSIISQDSTNQVETQYKFEFVQSESEDEDNPFIIPSLTSLGSISLEGKDSIATI